MKKIFTSILTVIGLFLGFIGTAAAALNAGVAAGFTGLQTDALALVDLAWPVVIAITVAFIVIGLFKKAAQKSV